MEDPCTPPEIKKSVQEAQQQLVPLKSASSYDKAFTKFMKYLLEMKLVDNAEDISGLKTVVTPKVVLSFFNHMSKKQAPSCLWPLHSMLKKKLKIHAKIDLKVF